MKRDIYRKLLEWKKSSRRKPLILRGARQVGKTYILKEFGANEYDNLIYINFEEDAKIRLVFEGDLTVEQIIEHLEVYTQQKIIPGKSLIFFDEIQSSPQILKALKYFNENFNDYHIVSAGSLLGISLAGAKSFPVGKVNFLDLYPLTFQEFLSAAGNDKLLSVIPETMTSGKPVPMVFHEKLLDLLKNYYYVGGMPEAVSDFLANNDYYAVRDIQNEILDSYNSDFAKHVPKSEAIRIKQIWDSIPIHLSKENRNFVFSAIKNSARAREYEIALQWLVDAGLIIKVQQVSQPRLPLRAYVEKHFKIYLLDVGLLGAMTELSVKSLLFKQELFTHFKGALVENYVMQQLCSERSLFYWSSMGKAEVDLVIDYQESIVPVEIKANVNLKAKSLTIYDQRFNPELMLRFSLSNFKYNKKLIDMPLYAVHRIIQ